MRQGEIETDKCIEYFERDVFIIMVGELTRLNFDIFLCKEIINLSSLITLKVFGGKSSKSGIY